MDIRDDFLQPALYLDLEHAAAKIESPYIEDIQKEVRELDLNRVLEAKSADDFIALAKKYAVFNNSKKAELSFDLNLDSPDGVEKYENQLRHNAIGYVDMQRHMKKAICLKALCDKKKVTLDDLEEAGIEIYLPSPKDIHGCEAGKYLLEAYIELTGFKGGALIEKMREQALCESVPTFSCLEYIAEPTTPYASHLSFGIELSRRQDIAPVGKLLGAKPRIFDIINRKFPDNADGYKSAMTCALDNLFRINLANAPTVTRNGMIEQKCVTVYALFWYELAKKLEGGRAMRCEACGKPLITSGERGMKRRFCGDACRKWSHRNPGEKRPVAR